MSFLAGCISAQRLNDRVWRLSRDGHVLSFLGKFLMAKKRDLGGLCKKSLSISFYLQNVPMDSKTRNWRENFNEFWTVWFPRPNSKNSSVEVQKTFWLLSMPTTTLLRLYAKKVNDIIAPKVPFATQQSPLASDTHSPRKKYFSEFLVFNKYCRHQRFLCNWPFSRGRNFTR